MMPNDPPHSALTLIDDRLESTENQRTGSEVIAAEIAEDLRAALQQFETIQGALRGD